MRKTASAVVSLALAAATALLMAPAVASADPASDTETEIHEPDAGDSTDGEVGAQYSWYTGTMAPGATANRQWNNAPAGNVYEVSFRPTGATTAVSCQFEKIRDWYAQQPGGEREYHYTIKNISSISCAATVYLSAVNDSHTGSTPGIDPGSSFTNHWNNANPQDYIYLFGLSPQGATSSSACQLEVTRTWYERSSSTEREFYFTIKNVGSITCAAETLYAKKPATSTWSSGSIAAGGSGLQVWNNPSAGVVFLLGLNPSGVSCELEVTRSWYVQRINSDGTTKYLLYFYVKNLAASSCSGTVQLTSIAA